MNTTLPAQTPEAQKVCTLARYLREIEAAVELRGTDNEAQARFLAAEDGYQPGAVIHSSWGYDQTQADYYLVIRRTAKQVTLVRLHTLEQAAPGYSPMAGLATPGGLWLACPDWPIVRRKLHYRNEKPSGFTLSYGWAKLWDGKPNYCSHYA